MNTFTIGHRTLLVVFNNGGYFAATPASIGVVKAADDQRLARGWDQDQSYYAGTMMYQAAELLASVKPLGYC